MKSLWCSVLAIAGIARSANGGTVSIQADNRLPPPARYGLNTLSEVLRAGGHSIAAGSSGDFAIVAGLSSGEVAAPALKSLEVQLPGGGEALVIRKTMLHGKPALILCGSDAQGLKYAALEVAETARAAPALADLFVAVQNTSESPYIGERGVSMYTMHRAYFESRLFDENHWRRYFDLLARSRINTFTVIFGYENGGYMAPVYPWFFNVASHPEVQLDGGTPAQQERYLKSFRTMIRLAHERGIDVIAAIWDHIYRGGVQSGGIPGASEFAGKPAPGLVTGLTADNLASYTKAALRRFMTEFPDIDGLEFRMHTESGLKREEMSGFWHEVFVMLSQAKPGMRVTLRAKDLPDSIIDDALRQGLRARIETKFWMEQMGLPFHPTHVNRQNQHDRRHGFADLLRYPQRYRVHWRLWSGGTTRLLLWSDPEYVRRFAESARVYGGDSLDVNEMLATKMLGEPHEKAPIPILTGKFRFYEYEFERYWPFYQVWGRVSYNPSVSLPLHEREFTRRFGGAGRDLMDGLHLASKILPRIVAAAYRYQMFPTTRGWAEMMRQDDLPRFAELEGSDIEQFMNPREAARSVLTGAGTSKRRPDETSRWFSDVSERVLGHVRRVEGSRVSLSVEAQAMIADLKILVWLARYYAERLPAAVSYSLYQETQDPAALDAALAQEAKAIAAWAEIVNAAGDVYSPDLAFGVHRVGFPRHWREELQRLRAGLERLTAQRKQLQDGFFSIRKPAERHGDAEPPAVRLEAAGTATPGKDLIVRARAQDPSGIKSLRLRYRHMTQFEDYLTAEMTATADTGLYTARIPAGFVDPAWDLMYFVEALDNAGNGRNYPDAETHAPYVIVPVHRTSRAAAR